MNSMPTYTIFAGVNGAGKTSIYKSIYYNENKDEKRINTDEMVARIGSWKDSNLQIKCSREAVKLIKYYILEGISFNQETTLSGKSIIKNIKFAKERVRIRVSKGGHGIPDKDIERRYYDSLNNLNSVVRICDEVNIYDNTEMLKEVIYLKDNKIIWRDKKMPNWANNILER